MLTERIGAHEKMAWMLRSMIGEAAGRAPQESGTREGSATGQSH
jgi:hypothetical protein